MGTLTQDEINFYLRYRKDFLCSDEIKKECERIEAQIDRDIDFYKKNKASILSIVEGCGEALEFADASLKR